MKFEVITQKENQLLKRKEIELAVDYEKGAVASKAAIAEFLQKNLIYYARRKSASKRREKS